MLNGRAMLVDTASQYGVTSIYLLAAWFQLAPIGYGTLGLLTGGLTALWFAAGYGVLRLAGTSRPLSAAAMGVAVVALVFNLAYPVGALPQSGPLRFGLPMLVVLAAVAGERFPARARAARVAAFASLGLASVWSLEALAFTAVVLAAVLCVQAWLAPGPGRLRWLARQAALAGLALRVRARHLRRRDARGHGPTCPTGRGTSPTCASSCSGASATSPTTSRAGPRHCRWARPTSRRPRRSPSWCAGAGRSSSASARRWSP